MKYLQIGVLVALACAPLLSEQARATPIVPYATGNTWTYVKYGFSATPDTTSETIAFDSLISEGRYVFRYEAGPTRYVYDTEGMLYTIGADDSLYLWLDFTASPGDKWRSMSLNRVYSSVVFGVEREVFVFATWSGVAGSSSEINRIHYAVGLGTVLVDILGPTSSRYELIGATIDGVQHGHVVSIEQLGDGAHDVACRISCYPNPVNDMVYLSGLASESNEAIVRIYSIMGILVREIRFMSRPVTAFSMEGLRAGMYYVEVVSGADRTTKKLLLN